MTKLKTMPVHNYPWYDVPLSYSNGDMFVVYFQPTLESYRRVLPEPLQPQLLGGAYFMRYNESSFGPNYQQAAVVVQCTYKEHYGFYFLGMYAESDVAIACHREVWGYPMKQAQLKWRQRNDRITAQVIRNKVPIVSLEINLEGPGEWIDTGDAIAIKLIPSVDGRGYDVKQITAGSLDYTIREGFAGEGKMRLQSTDDDPLGDLIEIESIIAGTLFKLDVTAHYGKILGMFDI